MYQKKTKQTNKTLFTYNVENYFVYEDIKPIKKEDEEIIITLLIMDLLFLYIHTENLKKF